MRVVLNALGSRGDVQPLLALGRGLAGAGYAVRIATHEPFRALVTGLGLDYAPIRLDSRAFLASDAGQDWVDSGENPVRFVLRLRRAILPELPSLFADLRAATADADVVVGATPGLPDGTVAEAAGAVFVRTSLVPITRTRAFPQPFVTAPPGRRLGGPFNAMSYFIADQVYWHLFRAEIQRWRRSLGLPPLPLSGPYRRFEQRRVLELNGFSPLVVPRPPDWPDWHHITGYWTFDDPAETAPQPELSAFLDAGPPPVFVGFGSTPLRGAPGLTELVLKALRTAGHRGVVVRGWGDIARGNGSAATDAFVVERVAFRWLFPRVLAAVHHGGAGTTGDAIAAGIPSVVVPFFGQQRFWGSRVADLGLGPRPIPRKRLTVDGLAAAIAAATDPAVRARAAAFGAQVAAEDGVATAVALFRRYLDGIGP
jgi:UDP:flavonoid glycosyltransferase YjiC (YdhE family)